MEHICSSTFLSLRNKDFLSYGCFRDFPAFRRQYRVIEWFGRLCACRLIDIIVGVILLPEDFLECRPSRVLVSKDAVSHILKVSVLFKFLCYVWVKRSHLIWRVWCVFKWSLLITFMSWGYESRLRKGVCFVFFTSLWRLKIGYYSLVSITDFLWWGACSPIYYLLCKSLWACIWRGWRLSEQRRHVCLSWCVIDSKRRQQWCSERRRSSCLFRSLLSFTAAWKLITQATEVDRSFEMTLDIRIASTVRVWLVISWNQNEPFACGSNLVYLSELLSVCKVTNIGRSIYKSCLIENLGIIQISRPK